MFNSEAVEKLKERIKACGDEGWATVDKELLEHCLFCMRYHCTYLVESKYVHFVKQAYYEDRRGWTIPVLISVVFEDPESVEFFDATGQRWISDLKDYNKTWRCWTAEPFDDIREEVKWAE